MRKTINYFVLLLLVLIPMNVFAISYTLGEPQDGKNGVKYIKIKVTDVAGLKQTEGLSCKTDDSSKSTCDIEALGDFKIDGSNNKFIYTTNEYGFSEGDEVGRIVVTNKTYEKLVTDVRFNINDSTKTTVEKVEVAAAPKPKSTDATLHSLSVNKGTFDPEFKADVQEYTIYGFDDTINKIKFTYTCDECTVKGEGGTSVSRNAEAKEITFGLAVGENNTKIIVTSQDGANSTTYSFKVFRGSTTYNSLKLKSLSVEGYELDPKFDKETKEYTIKVPKKMESIESLLKYEVEDDQAKVKVEGAGTLDKDENEVKITVTNRTGDTFEYKLKVIKEDQTSSVIEVIGYKDGKVSFMNPDGVREELGKDEFKEKYPDEWKKIEDGTYQFDENGNIIKEKEEEKKDTNGNTKKENKFPWIIVILIVLSLAIIGVAGFIIFRDPDKKKNKDGKEEPTDETTEIPTNPEEITPIVPIEEQEAELARMDQYDEEARLEAENSPVIEPEEIHEQIVKEEVIDDYVDDDKTPTTDIDEALSDLMNTKEYNFKDKE